MHAFSRILSAACFACFLGVAAVTIAHPAGHPAALLLALVGFACAVFAMLELPAE